MKSYRFHHRTVLLLLTLSLIFIPGRSVMAEETSNLDEWQFMGEIYLWGPEIDLGLANGASVDLSLNDIIESLDMVFMGTLGARYLWIETDLKLNVSDPLDTRTFKTTVSGHNWDGIIGVKGETELSNKWAAEAYLGAGTGDSD
jgi:hypothetical protein